MPRIKRYIQTGYTTFNNDMTRDQTLSITDRGLLVTMLALPDGWNITGRGLAKILPDGRDKVYASLSRLENHGYLKRHQIKINGRFHDEEYLFCDLPVFKEENAQLAKLKEEKKIVNTAKKKAKKEKQTESKYLLLSPTEKTEKEKEKIKEKFNSLTGKELRNYVAKEIFKGENADEIKSTAPEFFEIVVEVFSEIIENKPEKRDALLSTETLDMIYLFEEVKNKIDAETAVRTYFLEEGVFLR